MNIVKQGYSYRLANPINNLETLETKILCKRFKVPKRDILDEGSYEDRESIILWDGLGAMDKIKYTLNPNGYYSEFSQYIEVTSDLIRGFEVEKEVFIKCAKKLLDVMEIPFDDRCINRHFYGIIDFTVQRRFLEKHNYYMYYDPDTKGVILEIFFEDIYENTKRCHVKSNSMTDDIYKFMESKLTEMRDIEQKIVFDFATFRRPYEYIFGKNLNGNATFIPIKI